MANMNYIVNVIIIISISLLSVSGQSFDDLASSATFEANEFMDELLQVQMPKVFMEQSEERIHEFSVHISKKLFAGIIPTHRDIDALFIEGKLIGLGSIKRKGNCKPVYKDGRDLVISCELDLSSLKAVYNSAVVGFNLRGDVAHQWISVHFNGSSIHFEARQPIQHSVSPHISGLVIAMSRPDVEYEPFGFNSERDSNFREEIIRNVQPQLVRVLNGRFHQNLQDALRQDGVNIPDVRI